MQNFIETLNKFTEKLDRISWLNSIRTGVMATLPLIIIGSIFNIISSLPTLLPFLPEFSPSVSAAITLPYTVTFGVVGIVVAFSVAYQHAKTKGISPFFAGIISLVTFILVAAPLTEAGDYSGGYLGSAGMFTGMIIGIIGVEIMAFFAQKNLMIKMPASVPPSVSESFEAIIPGCAVVITFYILNLICARVSGQILPGLISAILSPLFKASNSLGFFLLILFVINGFWALGIHGFNIIGSVLMPLIMSNTAANAAAVAAGQEMPYIFTASLLFMAGNFYWLIPLMMMHCKSEQLRAVGKVALIPAIFSISEPIVFGAPIVGNPLMAIPLILYELFGGLLYYVATQIGFLNKSAVYFASQIPHPFFDYISTSDFRAFIVFAIFAAGTYLIWKPFLAAYDKQLCEKEKASAN